FFFFQAEDGIRDYKVTGVQTCALPILLSHHDYEGMAGDHLPRMRKFGCAHTKLAVTPRTLDDNLKLLRAIAPGVSVIGMGERGQIGRASCRERVEMSVVEGSLEEKI